MKTLLITLALVVGLTATGYELAASSFGDKAAPSDASAFTAYCKGRYQPVTTNGRCNDQQERN